MTGPAGTGLKRIWVAATAAALLAAVAGAWMLESALSPQSESALSSYAVVVSQNGSELARFSYDDFTRMPQTTVEMDGRNQTGPSLVTVLDQAGVDRYSSVVITGMGARDDGELVLTRDQIVGDVVVDLANRGTVKITAPDLARADRVRDVTRIEVR